METGTVPESCWANQMPRCAAVSGMGRPAVSGAPTFESGTTTSMSDACTDWTSDSTGDTLFAPHVSREGPRPDAVRSLVIGPRSGHSVFHRPQNLDKVNGLHTRPVHGARNGGQDPTTRPSSMVSSFRRR